MSDTRVRDMVEADLQIVGELAGQLVQLHHTYDPARFFFEQDIEEGYRWWFGRELKKDNVVLLVVELEGEIVGYFYGSVEQRDWARLLDPHGAMHDVFVNKRFRRRGLARALMAAGLEALTRKGARQFVLSSAVQNLEARALFRSLGFRETMVELTR